MARPQYVTANQRGALMGFSHRAFVPELNQNGNAFCTGQNVQIIEGSRIITRTGAQYVNNLVSGTPIKGGFCFRKPGASAQNVIINSGHCYTGVIAGSSLTTPTLALTDRGSGLSTSALVSMTQFRDGTGECVYIADGSSKLSKWDGTTFTANNFGAALSLTCVWVYNQRLFGVTGADTTLYWSALNNGDSIGDTATGGGSATIRTYGAAKILAGTALGNTNLIFHEGGISKFVGRTFDDIQIAAGTSGHAPNVGLIAPRAFCVVDASYVVLLSTAGLVLVDEQGAQAIEQPDVPDECLWSIQTYGPPTGTPQWTPTRYAQIDMAWNPYRREVLINLPGADLCYSWSVDRKRFTGLANGSESTSLTYAPWGNRLTSLWESVDTISGSPRVLSGTTGGYLYIVDCPGLIDVTGVNPREMDDLTTSATPRYMSSSVRLRLWPNDIGEQTVAWRALAFEYGCSANSQTDMTVAGVSGIVGTNSQTFSTDAVTPLRGRVAISGNAPWYNLILTNGGGATSGVSGFFTLFSVEAQGYAMNRNQ